MTKSKSQPNKLDAVKNLLSDPNSKIKLHDLFLSEARTILVEAEDCFIADSNYSEEEFLRRVKKLEELMDDLLFIYPIGIYWSNSDIENVWTKVLKLLAYPTGEHNGKVAFLNLRKYPALLLLYSGGIAALASENYQILADLLVNVEINDNGILESISTYLEQHDVIEKSLANLLREAKNEHTPLSNHLFSLLRPKFLDIVPLDSDYEELFKRFEYLLAIVIADRNYLLRKRYWGPMGRFAWGRFWDDEHGIAKTMERKISNGLMDECIKHLFGGSIDRLNNAKSAIDEITEGTGWS